MQVVARGEATAESKTEPSVFGVDRIPVPHWGRNSQPIGKSANSQLSTAWTPRFVSKARLEGVTVVEPVLRVVNCDGSGGGVIVVDTGGAPTDEGVERLPDL